jgi:DNA-binding Xre family transcriptional regulator
MGKSVQSQSIFCQAAFIAIMGEKACLMILLRVKEVAESKGISMHRLSRISDINITTLQTIYHNPHHNLSLQTLDKLAQALDVHPMDLIEYTKDEKK